MNRDAEASLYKVASVLWHSLPEIFLGFLAESHANIAPSSVSTILYLYFINVI